MTITETLIRQALELVHDMDNRNRDPHWYRNNEVISALEGMMAGKAPPSSLDSYNGFETASVSEAIATGNPEALRPTDPSVLRNRCLALWAVAMLWRDERLRARLNRCDTCQRFYLRGNGSIVRPAYCSSKCRYHSRHPAPKYRWKNPRVLWKKDQLDT